ncbi:MAG: hypothetical protein V7632_4210 [Bradyrhizobium sp.]
MWWIQILIWGFVIWTGSWAGHRVAVRNPLPVALRQLTYASLWHVAGGTVVYLYFWGREYFLAATSFAPAFSYFAYAFMLEVGVPLSIGAIIGTLLGMYEVRNGQVS